MKNNKRSYFEKLTKYKDLIKIFYCMFMWMWITKFCIKLTHKFLDSNLLFCIIIWGYNLLTLAIYFSFRINLRSTLQRKLVATYEFCSFNLYFNHYQCFLRTKLPCSVTHLSNNVFNVICSSFKCFE